MRNIDFSTPSPIRHPLLPRLTGHLEARLLDFGPGGPEIAERRPEEGWVSVRFPGRDAGQVLAGLAALGIRAALQGDRAVFYLSPHSRFEDLDYLWGCLFQLL